MGKYDYINSPIAVAINESVAPRIDTISPLKQKRYKQGEVLAGPANVDAYNVSKQLNYNTMPQLKAAGIIGPSVPYRTEAVEPNISTKGVVASIANAINMANSGYVEAVPQKLGMEQPQNVKRPGYAPLFGQNMVIGEGYRSPLQSDEAAKIKYEAMPGGTSPHNYRQAFDLDQNQNVPITIMQDGVLKQVLLPQGYAARPLLQEQGMNWGGDWDRNKYKGTEDQHYQDIDATTNIAIKRRIEALKREGMASQYKRFKKGKV